MQPKRYYLILSLLGFFIVVASGIWLATAQQVNAQCGSSTSSCKNCHEVQGKKPVNNDGKPWHQSHAFGDFCYICHGGNSTATDETQAHTGMVSPLSDIKASCGQCHAKDLTQRAQVYATILGVSLNTTSSSGSSTASGSSTQPTPTPAQAAPVAASASSAIVTTQLNLNDPNLVDYYRTYDEVVLGKKPTNWGNVILLLVIGFVGIGGGGFVITHEKWVKLTFGDTKKVEGEYPSEIVDMLPDIKKLDPQTRKSLKNILDKPQKTGKVLGLIDEIVSDEKSEEEKE